MSSILICRGPESALWHAEAVVLPCQHYRSKFLAANPTQKINVLVLSKSRQGQVTIRSRSGHDQVTVRSRSSHGQVTIRSRSGHDQVTVISRDSHVNREQARSLPSLGMAYSYITEGHRCAGLRIIRVCYSCIITSISVCLAPSPDKVI